MQLITERVPRSGDEAEWLDTMAQGMPDQADTGTGSSRASQANGSSVRAKELEGLSGDSDVLMVPKLETGDGESTRSLVLGHLVLIVISNCTGHACSSIKVQGRDTQRAKNMQMRLHCMKLAQRPWGHLGRPVRRLCKWLRQTCREGG